MKRVRRGDKKYVQLVLKGLPSPNLLVIKAGSDDAETINTRLSVKLAPIYLEPFNVLSVPLETHFQALKMIYLVDNN